MYNDNDNDNLDNYSGYINRGSRGGHIKEGYIDDNKSKGGYIDNNKSEGGYTKEGVYIKGEEEDIYGVLDGEWEA